MNKEAKIEAKKEHLNVVLVFGIFIITVMGVAALGYHFYGNEPDITKGDIVCDELRVSSKSQGRIARLYVSEGQYVRRGDTLAVLSMPELEEQKRAAAAAAEAAAAVSEMTENGNRREQISSADDEVSRARAVAGIASKTLRRVSKLCEDGVASTQKRDEAEAAYRVAEAQLKAAMAHSEMMHNGARKEERKAAESRRKAAESNTAAADAVLSEQVQTAAADGTVNKIFIHEGEVAAGGATIMTLTLNNDIWARFNIREDKMGSIRMGKTIYTYIPATGQNIRMKVYYIQGEGDCATWKATKASKGYYDLKTLEIRARPAEKNSAVKAGMTVVLRKR